MLKENGKQHIYAFDIQKRLHEMKYEVDKSQCVHVQ